MKTMINKFGILILLNLFIITSCSKDDSDPFVATASDVITTIDEHSSSGTSLGTVATNLTGNLVYSFTSQSVANALSINSTTGQISIADSSKFDFETNPTIEAMVSVTNSSDTATAIISITLNNIDDILHFLSSSKQSYMDATAGDWILVTENEYITLANSLNEVTKVATSDEDYIANITNITGANGWTVASNNGEIVPNSSYIFAFKYDSRSNDVTDNVVKLSTTSISEGYFDLGGILPQHNSGENYFVLKGNNTQTENTGYLGFYSSKGVVYKASSTKIRYNNSGNTNTLTQSPNNYIVEYQGLSTTQKQWD